MPNWCDNQVTITGPNSVIDKIEKITKEEDGVTDSSDPKGLLQFMHPMPAELRDTTADGSKDKAMIEKTGYSDWYSWAVDNWGTKWEVCEFYGVDRQHLNDSLDESTISFGFSSAWGPPLGAYDQFLADNENCSLIGRYYEGGCDFMGVWDNGDDRCYSCSEDGPKSDSPFYDHGDGKEIDDYFGITETLADYEAEQETEAEQKVRELVVEKKAVNIGEDV
jgi:hypothetical protein